MSAREVTIVVSRGCGWDAERREVVGRLSRDAAREQHASGRPYCVMLSDEGGAPRARVLMDTGSGYVGLGVYDEIGRPSLSMDYHRFGEVPYLTWFDRRRGTERRRRRTPVEYHVIPALDFGSLPVDETCATVEARFTYVDDQTVAAKPDGAVAAVASWAVPDLSPLRPNHVTALFTPGARFGGFRQGREVLWSVGVVECVGRVRLPTGRVVATDAGLVADDAEPFVAEVTPGEYPQYLAYVSEDGQARSAVSAVKLEISRRPTVSWEHALRPSEDLALLGRGEIYGFGVDSGLGAVLDHSGCAAFSPFAGDSYELDGDELQQPDGPGEACDRLYGTSTNMIAYETGYGDGVYPVWVGRDQDGEVTCFVADMLVLCDAELPVCSRGT